MGDTDCEGRGYETEDFAELDIGSGTTSYVLTLTAANSGIVDENDTGNDTFSGLRFCNDTEHEQSVSVGYEGPEGWTSEGWWNVEPNDCANTIVGPLQKRYYYYRAEVDGGPFDGEAYTFCTTPEAYTIVGDTDCEARGYDKETFREIDIGEGITSYTLTLIPPAGSDTGNDTTQTDTNVTGTDTIDETAAGLEVCNDTEFEQHISIGYEGDEGWTSEGWWAVAPGACSTPALDNQRHRYLYYRAEIDGGPFTGQNYFFCTTPEAYTIVGDTDCEARGYEREDFREIDIGSEGMFTLTLVADDVPDSTPDQTGTDTDTGDTTLGDRLGGDETPPDPEPEPDPTPEPDTTPDVTVPEEEPEQKKPPRRTGSRGG